MVTSQPNRSIRITNTLAAFEETGENFMSFANMVGCEAGAGSNLVLGNEIGLSKSGSTCLALLFRE
jgi:hypothetical protein